MNDVKRGYHDLHEHLETLKAQGLLVTIDRPIDKDAELHPLVRWQFVGGLDEGERKAFLFTHVVDGRGRRYAMPVVVGAIAANRAIYSAGMGVPVEEIPARWDHAIANPVPPRIVDRAACQEVVIEGVALLGEGHGLDRLPIPISTPGFDSAPTLTATNVITRDPSTGVQNMGTYRAALKAPDRLVVRMATRVGGAGGYLHYRRTSSAVTPRCRARSCSAVRPAWPSSDRRSSRSAWTSSRWPADSPARRSTWCARAPSISSSPPRPRWSSKG